MRLGISQATKNVNVRQAEVLRKKDEEYQYTIQNLEYKLHMANAEIERLKTRYMMTGKTADSLQDHRGRLKKYRNNFGMEFNTPRSFDKPGISGWSTARSTPKGEKDRISINSVGSLNSQKHGPASRKPDSGKHGRTSVP